ncbi:M23 family metallopeptidase [soil metagenome]
MRPFLSLCCVLLAAGLAQSADADAHAVGPTPALVVRSGPTRILVERLPDRQDLNFELFVDNPGALAMELVSIEVSAFDASGRLLLRRLLDGNGVRPSIQTLPQRKAGPGETLTLFNPFASFAPGLDLARLDYRLAFDTGATDAAPLEATLSVHPVAFSAANRLRFPLRGRAWNYDGHDALAHHRRFDYSFAPIAALGFHSNFMRYAADFVPVAADGRAHPDGRDANADWIGFGADVLSVADGVVVAASDGAPDDRKFDQDKLRDTPMVLFGNHVVIDHGHGEFSVYGHLQQGSVQVRVGNRVRAGAPIGRIGASGSAMFPHLHFQLQDGPTLAAEGLPTLFDGLRDQAGTLLPAGTVVDTGRIVEAR